MSLNAPSFDIATLLDTNAFGTLGTDLFAMAWGDGVDSQLLVLDSGSIDRGQQLQSEQPLFQILARGAPGGDIATTHELLRDVHEFLLPLDTTTINGLEYLGFYTISAPTGIGRDENDRAVYTANYSSFRNPI